MNYTTKKEDYFKNIRRDLISFIDKKKGCKVLEVGAANGETLAFLKNQGIATEVVGVDVVGGSKNHAIDTFIVGEIEQVDLSKYSNYFDVIILADVLEHLSDPLEVLKRLKAYLKSDGEFLISMPNIRNAKSLYKIVVKGSFAYEERGVFDATHLRFFCKKDIVKLVADADLHIEQIASSFKRRKGNLFIKTLNTLSLGLFEEFFTVQYLVKATM